MLECKWNTTVLTPEQRTKADKVEEQWRRRLDQMVDRLNQAAD
jgi:hypothetical protein